IRLWSTGTWQETFRDTNGSSRWDDADAVLFSPDGKTLATRMQGAPGQKHVGFWDIQSGRWLTPLDSRDDELGADMTYSRDGRLLALGYKNELQVLDARSLNLITNLIHTNDFGWPYSFAVASIAFSGNLVAAGHRLGAITIWDTKTWTELACWR